MKNKSSSRILRSLLSLCLLALFLEVGASAAGERAYVDSQLGIGVDELVETAFRQNADLLAARQSRAEARGLLMQAELRPNPTLEANITSGSVLSSPGERELTIGYSHPFELGGKRQRRIDAARLGGELADLEIADRERLLKAELEQKYGEALAAVRNLDTAALLLELSRQTYQVVEARVREGEAAALEQGLLQVEVSRLEADRLVFENQVERWLLELKPLAGMNIDDPLVLKGDLAPRPVALSVQQATTRALGARPDLAAAKIREALAEAELRSARAEGAPDLIGFARYSRVDSRFDPLGISAGGTLVPLRDTDNLLTGGFSLALPFRNRNQGNIEAALARLNAARLRRGYREQLVVRDVRSAYNRYDAARRAVDLFDREIIVRAQENLRVVRGSYDLGELRILDVIIEHRRLVDTQKAYTELLKEHYLARVELERAMNGPVQ
jgi:cobalt-zinc-cadmium efflux system outer membrane protein